MKRTLAVIITAGLAVTGCQSPVNQQAVSQETIEITETQELISTETSAGDAAAGGNTLITTVDSRIQNAVEDRISEWQQEVGSDHIGIIVMNPQNGEVLAMAGSSEDFCINYTYEPGAIAQVFPAAAALEEGILTGDETFICDGSETFGDATIRCIRHSGHGELTLEESLIHSCNDAAMQIAAMEGPEVFAKYQELFGFGSKTGIDLTGEADTGNLVLGSGEMDSVSLATNALGQNYNCTMIQMAAA